MPINILNSPLFTNPRGFGSGFDEFEDRQMKREEHGLLSTIRDLQAKRTKEELKDYIVDRPARHRKTVADALQSEVKAKLDQREAEIKLPMLERLMYADLNKKEADARKTNVDADMVEQYGPRKAEAGIYKDTAAGDYDAVRAQTTQQQAPLQQRKLGAEAGLAEQQSQYYQPKVEAEIGNQRALGDLHRQQSAGYQDQQSALAGQRDARANEARVKATGERENIKQNAIFANLSNIDLNDPNSVALALNEVNNVVPLTNEEYQFAVNNPQVALQRAGVYAGEPDRDIQRANILRQNQKKPVDFGESKFKLEAGLVARDLAGTIFGEATLLDPENSSYDASVAEPLKNISMEMVNEASKGGATREQYEQRLEMMKNAFFSTYRDSLTLARNPERAITDYAPRNMRELNEIKETMYQATQGLLDENAPAAKFKAWMDNLGTSLEKNPKAAELQGKKLGLTEKVTNYLIAQQLRELRAQ